MSRPRPWCRVLGTGEAPVTSWARLPALLACAVLAAGCGGGGEATSQVTTTAADETSGTLSPNGTTTAGAVLRLGDKAVVRWRADKAHESRIGLTVNAARRGAVRDLKQFTLDRAARGSSVYYVSVDLVNLGRGDFSGQLLTLYGKVSAELVVPPVRFASSFDRCDYAPLPDTFRSGSKTHVCMVMLAPRHGRISAVQWRPAPTSEPISWRVP